MRRPMRTVAVVLISAALGVASAFLVACGDRNDLIPGDDAAALRSDLDRASANYSREECRDSETDIRRARARAAGLPPEVDGALRRTLRDNLDHALARVEDECGRRQRTQATQTTITTPTAPTTETTQETTAPETTAPETTAPETTATPPTTAPELPADPGEPGGNGGSGGSGGTSPEQGRGRGRGDG